jgi:hypothetical protein
MEFCKHFPVIGIVNEVYDAHSEATIALISGDIITIRLTRARKPHFKINFAFAVRKLRQASASA